MPWSICRSGSRKKRDNKVTSNVTLDNVANHSNNNNDNKLSVPPKQALSKASVKNLGKMFKELECPVCYNTCTPPIETCKNGHIICTNCRAFMNACPTCRERFTGTRNFFAENFIIQYAQPCKFKADGCEFIRWKGENMSPHENACQFRNVDCVVPSCSKALPYRSLLDHLITEHKIAGSDKLPTLISYDVLDPIISTRKWLPYFIRSYDNLFFVMMEVTRPSFYIWVWVQECKKEALNNNTVFVTSMRFQNCDKTLVYNWEGPVHSIRVPSAKLKNEGLCFIIPESVMQHFEKDSRISMFINIEKRKVANTQQQQQQQQQKEGHGGGGGAVSTTKTSGYSQEDDTIPDEIFHHHHRDNPQYPPIPSSTVGDRETMDMYGHNLNINSYGPIPSQR